MERKYVESKYIEKVIEKTSILDFQNLNISDDDFKNFIDNYKLKHIDMIILRYNPQITDKTINYILDSTIGHDVMYEIDCDKGYLINIDIYCDGTQINMKEDKFKMYDEPIQTKNGCTCQLRNCDCRILQIKIKKLTLNK